jgi:hypothetical protein
MALDESGLRTELTAAKAAIDWTSLFAELLHRAARAAAKDGSLVTIEHYKQALPIAASGIVAAIESGDVEMTDAESQAA